MANPLDEFSTPASRVGSSPASPDSSGSRNPLDEFSTPASRLGGSPDSLPFGGGVGRAAEAPSEPTSVASDVAQSAGAGLRAGVVSIPGLPGSIEKLGRMGIDYAAQKLGYDNPNTVEGQVLPDAAFYQSRDQEMTEPYYKPQTKAGEYAKTIGEFAPAALLPGGLIQRVGMNVVAPAVGSETAGQLTRGTPYETAARVAGAIVSPTVARGAVRMVTPAPATAARQAHVDVLENEGVNLSAGNATGYRPLQWMESVAKDNTFSATPAAELTDRQLREFTSAALRRVGEIGEEASPEVMRAARQRISGEFDRLTAHNNVDFNVPGGHQVRQTLAQRVQQAELEYDHLVPPNAAQKPIVVDLVDDINRQILTGVIPGDMYQAWRSRIGRMADGAEDPQFARFLGQTQRALDDAMEATIPRHEVVAWRTARDQWAHLKELQAAMARAGEAAANGQVTPQALRSADQAANSRAYVEGTGRYSDIARAGTATMPQLPNSGTPARNALTLTGVINQAVPGVIMRGLVSPFLQGYLGNQRATPLLREMSAPAARAAQMPADIAQIDERATPVKPSLAGNAMSASQGDGDNSMSTPDGVTATSLDGKRRLILKGNKWVPLQQ